MKVRSFLLLLLLGSYTLVAAESSRRRRRTTEDPCPVGKGYGKGGNDADDADDSDDSDDSDDGGKGYSRSPSSQDSGNDSDDTDDGGKGNSRSPSNRGCGPPGVPTLMPAGFSYPALAPTPSPFTDFPSGKGGKGSSDATSQSPSGKGGKGSSDYSTYSPTGKGDYGKGYSEMRGRRHRELIDVSEELPQATDKKRTGQNGQSSSHSSLRGAWQPPKKKSKGSPPPSTLERKRTTRDTKSHKHQDKVDVPLVPEGEYPIIEQLKGVDTRYYIYDDCDILQCDLLEKLRQAGPPKNTELDHITTDARAEADIIDALSKHPLRTNDPKEASLYIVPLAISELIAYGCQWEDCKWFEESFESLFNHSIFQEHHGNRHVLISQHWVAFNSRFPHQFPAMATIYRQLRNVTVSMHFDPFGCMELANDPARSHGSGFSPLFQWEGQPLTRAFSVGLIGTTDLPFQAATMDKFNKSRYLAFYHTRTTPLAFRSTKYRVALLANSSDAASLPEASIGVDIPKNDWIEHFLSSKFCLSIRGDTPHSHTLLHSLRAGCIPVVVSDFYEDYAPSFKSILAIKDWTIVIDEADFLNDPFGQIRALHELPTSFIEEKIANVSLAQSIVLSESPYFVNAFLQESIRASQLLAPADDSVFAHQQKSTFSFNGTMYQYRYPTLLLGSVDLFHEAPVIVGVFSSPEQATRREVIRESWSKNRRVFFILSGHWNDIADEFHTFGDILWMDMSKAKELGSSAVTNIQSSMFAHALEEHVESYGYMGLTSDDHYIDMDKVEILLHLHRPDYWGGCNDPTKHLGYFVSRKFNHCAVKTVSEGKINHLTNNRSEETAISVLAEQCGIKCTDFGWEYSNDWTNPITEVTSGRDFFYLHEKLLWAKQISPYYEGIATDEEEGNVIAA